MEDALQKQIRKRNTMAKNSLLQDGKHKDKKSVEKHLMDVKYGF